MKFDEEEKKLAINPAIASWIELLTAQNRTQNMLMLNKYSINELNNKDIINVVWSMSQRKELTNIQHNLEREEIKC